MTGRSVPEWVGSSSDAKVPHRVRARVFVAHGGVCAISGQLIRPGDEWHVDHDRPLCLGGEHRESNLRPVLAEPHRAKTAGEVKAKAKADRVRAKHIGAKKPRAVIPGSKASGWKRRLDGTTVRRDA